MRGRLRAIPGLSDGLVALQFGEILHLREWLQHWHMMHKDADFIAAGCDLSSKLSGLGACVLPAKPQQTEATPGPGTDGLGFGRGI